MADTKISAAADIVSVVSTDMLPVARSGSTTAYHATMAEIATWANTNLPTASTTVLGASKIDGTSITISGGVISSSLALSGATPLMDGTAAPGSGPTASRTDHVHPTDATRAPLASPALTGSPTAPTVTPATDNTTKIATTAFVQSAMSAAGAGVSSWNTRTGAVTLNNADVVAVLAPSSTTPSMDGTAAVGTGTTWARADHVHPTDTSRAPIASPTFTGTPSLPTGTTGVTQTAGNNTTALATTQFVQAAAAPAFNDTGRNLIHNGQFTIQQRGAGPWTTNFAYTVDRWELYITGDTNSVYPVALADTARSAIGDEAATWCVETDFTGAATSGNYTQLAQKIENVRTLGGKIVAVSFWATASASLRLDVGLTQNFGTGGSPSAAVGAGSASFTIGTTWARYTASITIPSTSGKTLGTNNDSYTQLAFMFTNGAVWHQSGTFQLWGVQLEIGSVATPLEKRDPQQQLAECQRFYQVYSSVLNYQYAATGSGLASGFPLSPQMRAIPTAAFSSVVHSNSSGLAAYVLNPGYFVFSWSVTATGVSTPTFTVALSADL